MGFCKSLSVGSLLLSEIYSRYSQELPLTDYEQIECNLFLCIRKPLSTRKQHFLRDYHVIHTPCCGKK